MTAVTQETLRILCRAIGADPERGLPADDVARVEQWCDLPGFTVDRFRKIILATQQRGVRVSSVRYWEGAVADTFRPLPSPSEARRPRLLSELPWREYLSRQTASGPLDAQVVADLRFRWERERGVLGLPIEEEEDANTDPLPAV